MKWTLSLSNEDGTTLELRGNHLGTTTGQVVPEAGFPLKGGTTPDQPHPVLGTTSNLYGLTDAELLDCLGPSWSEMKDEERAEYPCENWRHFVRDAA